MRILFFFCLSFIFWVNSNQAHSQCENIYVHGAFEDTLNNYRFFHAVIFNKRENKAFFGNPDGSFEFFAMNGDTIVVSVTGFVRSSFVVNASKDCKFYKKLLLQTKTNPLKTVYLKPIKSISEIKEERNRLALQTTRTVTGVEILNSPITYLYESFSRKERNKKWVAQQVFKEKQQELISDYIKNCIQYKLIDLDYSEIDEFVQYLNLDLEFFRSASDYNLALHIKRTYRMYRLNK